MLINQIKQDRELLEGLWSGMGGDCDSGSNIKGKFVSVFVPEGFTAITTIVPIIEVEDTVKLDTTANITVTLNSSDTMDKIDVLKPARGIVYGIISVAIFWSIFILLFASFQ